MMMPYLDIVVRSLAVYIFMVAAIRIFGKNQLSQLNAGDVVLLLLISNSVQNAMVGSNVSLEGGLVAALVLFLTNFGLKKYIFRNKKVKEILESDPKILIKDGYINEKNILDEEIDLGELQEAVREHGVERISQVKLAMLEVDGNISVISYGDDQQTHYSRHRLRRILRRKL